MPTGKVVRWGGSGYGFIRPNAGGKDHWFHARLCRSVTWVPQEGDEVEFRTVPDGQGRLQAHDVHLVDEDEDSGSRTVQETLAYGAVGASGGPGAPLGTLGIKLSKALATDPTATSEALGPSATELPVVPNPSELSLAERLERRRRAHKHLTDGRKNEIAVLRAEMERITRAIEALEAGAIASVDERATLTEYVEERAEEHDRALARCHDTFVRLTAARAKDPEKADRYDAIVRRIAAATDPLEVDAYRALEMRLAAEVHEYVTARDDLAALGPPPVLRVVVAHDGDVMGTIVICTRGVWQDPYSFLSSLHVEESGTFAGCPASVVIEEMDRVEATLRAVGIEAEVVRLSEAIWPTPDPSALSDEREEEEEGEAEPHEEERQDAPREEDSAPRAGRLTAPEIAAKLIRKMLYGRDKIVGGKHRKMDLIVGRGFHDSDKPEARRIAEMFVSEGIFLQKPNATSIHYSINPRRLADAHHIVDGTWEGIERL